MDAPLYRVVAKNIVARIVGSIYKTGTTLPSEHVLEAEFNVSRITIRQALAMLKRRGFLYSRSGLGTLVRPQERSLHSMRVTGAFSDLLTYGGETVYHAIDRKAITPPDHVAKELGLPQDTLVLRFRGVRDSPDA